MISVRILKSAMKIPVLIQCGNWANTISSFFFPILQFALIIMVSLTCSLVIICLWEIQEYYADEIGVLSPNQLQVEELYAGEVKYII